jgi:hypothetical protein
MPRITQQNARSSWQAQRGELEARGVVLPGVTMFVPEEWKHDYTMAMDASPPTVTDPNSAIPVWLTTMIDPDVIRIAFSPNAFGKILGERKKGTWLDETAMFPVLEHTGEVSSYGDFNNNGRAGLNMNWPQFQSYLFQTFIRYGEREMERAGLAKINYVSELQGSAADILNRYQNLTYAFGVSGLQNYGIMNNPYVSAAMTPAPKAAGGTSWFANGVPNATANEVYNDIVALVTRVIAQTGGVVDLKSPMTLIMSPGSEVALTFTNAFGVNVTDLLKKNYPNMTIETAVQYGALSASNPNGSAGGNVMMLIVTRVDNQEVVYASFPEKMRSHKLIAEPSAWMQKMTSGTWGTILRVPAALASMIGI